MNSSPAARPAIPRLHIVTDDDVLNQSDFVTAALDLLLNLQHRFALHIRAKALSTARLHQLVIALREKAETTRTLLLVNDRVDVALVTSARGVQLNARSLPVATVRALAGKRLAIGYSAHTPVEARQAEEDGADFVFAGSIYATASHPGAPVNGINLLHECADACSRPVLAIGGVTPGRVTEVLSSGAYGVAVISAVWQAADPVQAAEEFVKMLET